MRKFLHESKFLILFFVIFTAITASTYIDFGIQEKQWVARSPEEILKATQTDSLLPLLDRESKRKPAAIETSKTEVIKAELFCQKAAPARFRKAAQSLVMLNLNVCDDPKSARHIWVKNTTNGFKAQVFKTADKNFRTDFIQLNQGSNKVLIEAILKDGQKRVQSLEIISGF